MKKKSKKIQNKIIEDDRGQWAHPGKVTKIKSNRITMKGVKTPLIGISDEGDVQMMYPEQEYQFKGKNVTEIPLAQFGDYIPKANTYQLTNAPINPNLGGMIQPVDNPTPSGNGKGNFLNKIGGPNALMQGIGAFAGGMKEGNEGGPSAGQRAVGQFGPVGAAISQVSQIGVNLFGDKNTMFNQTGKALFDPSAALSNKDFNLGQKLYGTINPFAAGRMNYEIQEKKDFQESELKRLTAEANSFQDPMARKYTRPEDNIIDPNTVGSSYGTGTSFLQQGGEVPQMKESGELQTLWGGNSKAVSYNPFLPDEGESIEFRGQSHNNGGIGVSFGGNKVEVEDGEPAVKLENGDNLTVFGNMKIPNYGVSEIEDPKAKGKKFKTYVSSLNKEEQKINKVQEEGLKLINESDQGDTFEKLSFASGKAMFEGTNMKLKSIAQKKQAAANVQKALLDTAEEFNLDSEALSNGKIKKMKASKKTVQDGGVLSGIFGGKKNKNMSSTTGLPLPEFNQDGTIGSRGNLGLAPGYEEGMAAGSYEPFKAVNRAYQSGSAKPGESEEQYALREMQKWVKKQTPEQLEEMNWNYKTPEDQMSLFMTRQGTRPYVKIEDPNAPVKHGNVLGRMAGFKKGGSISKAQNGTNDLSSNQIQDDLVWPNLNLNFNIPEALQRPETPLYDPFLTRHISSDKLQKDLMSNPFESRIPSATRPSAPISVSEEGVPIYSSEFSHSTNYLNNDPYAPREDGLADLKDNTKKGKGKNFDVIQGINTLLPYFRPSNQKDLDPNQLAGEHYALATNQLEGVQAQKYSPLLEQTSDVSFQDQLNANQADFNSLKRLTGNNPSAQAALSAQKYKANSQVLGEQFRINQTQKMDTFNKNRQVLNDATLKNLQILDQQYVRQEGAKSRTKATNQAALNSISSKIAQNKLENRTLGMYENLYNYRFGNKGYAWNMNGVQQWNTNAQNLPVVEGAEDQKLTEIESKSVRKNQAGIPLGSTERKTTVKKDKNGGIVRSFKKY